MTESEKYLKRRKDKVQHLLKQHIALQKENHSLKEELESITIEATQFRENSNALKQQVEILKYTNGEMEEEDKKHFEKRIQTYIKEIDRCITMLSR
jgi:hypothetical protein